LEKKVPAQKSIRKVSMGQDHRGMLTGVAFFGKNNDVLLEVGSVISNTVTFELLELHRLVGIKGNLKDSHSGHYYDFLFSIGTF
jgi:hypothetical protein